MRYSVQWRERRCLDGAVLNVILCGQLVGRREKLIQQICARPPAARFGTVRSLLEEFGWKRDRQAGSHVTFVKQGEFPITVPFHSGKVGQVYLTKICERLDLDCESL